MYKNYHFQNHPHWAVAIRTTEVGGKLWQYLWTHWNITGSNICTTQNQNFCVVYHERRAQNPGIGADVWDEKMSVMRLDTRPAVGSNISIFSYCTLK
jgi:hypothetical protein